MSFLMKILEVLSKIKLRVIGMKVSGKEIYIKKNFKVNGNPKQVQINGKEGLYIGPNSMISCFDNGEIQIGTNFSATEYLRLTSKNKVTIGDNVLLGSSVTILDCNHGMNPEVVKGYNRQEMLLDEVHIEDGVWCGDHVIILPGVTIGQHSIIGAGSVVTKSIPEYCIAAGNPAKIIKRWNFDSKSWKRIGN